MSFFNSRFCIKASDTNHETASTKPLFLRASIDSHGYTIDDRHSMSQHVSQLVNLIFIKLAANFL